MYMVLDVVGDVCRVFFVDYTLHYEPRCVFAYRYVVSRVCCVLVWVQTIYREHHRAAVYHYSKVQVGFHLYAHEDVVPLGL